MDFYQTIKDNNNIYYIFEYLNGLDFAEALREIGLLTAKKSVFYFATLILIVEFIHSFNIVHRDIKPENFVIDSHVSAIKLGILKID